MAKSEKGADAGSPVAEDIGPARSLPEPLTSEKAESAPKVVVSAETGDEEKSQKPWHLRLKSLVSRGQPPVPEERQPSKETTASVFSGLIFHWIAPLMHVGYKRPLELNDIWLVNPSRSVDRLEKQLSGHFKERIASGVSQPLLRAMYSTFKREFLLGGFFQLLSTILLTVSPYVLKYLIAFASKAYNAQRDGTPEPRIGEGIGLVFAIVGMQVCVSISINQFFYFGAAIGGQARAVLMAMIFDKALRISGKAKAGGPKTGLEPPSHVEPGSEEEKKWYSRALSKMMLSGPKPPKGPGDGDEAGWSNGRIVNLMSTDTWRIDQASGMFHMSWASPLSILITLALLVVNLSYSALPGVGLLFLSTPLLGKAIRALFQRRAKVTKITDQRVSLTQEILQAVRFIKYFGWETSFLNHVNEIRKREIDSIRVILAIRDGINAISMSMPVFAAMLSFITYSLTKNVLTPAPIFSSLAMFNGLRMPLNFLPVVIGQIIDAYVSVGRIQDFLLAEEASEEIDYDLQGESAVSITDASFTWERTLSSPTDNSTDDSSPRLSSGAATATEPFQLRNINLKLKRGELVAVIGSVGSGKTSLLEALAGNMRKTDGHVTLGCQNRAFCPQYAWIQNATVRENIIFGKPFDADWYGKVLDACALRPDMAALPDGDMTEIGERGITVSGGQKQRINVARAIYCHDAEFILMDDPLSAVDAHVGRHIMEQAVCGLLAGKSRILATHQLHVLHRCDSVIWMRDGTVEAVGTYDDLMAHNDEFAKLMASTSMDEEDNKEKETEAAEVQKESKKEDEEPVEEDKQGALLMQVEDRAVRSVSWRVYAAYLVAAGSIMIAPLVLVFLTLAQATNILTSLWLSWWTAQKWEQGSNFYIGIYAGLGVLQVIFLFLFSVSISIFGTQASKVMLYRAMVKVLRAPMSFFDTTPLGRITNRLSKDIDVMDNDLTDAIRMYYMTLGMIISVFVLIISYYYYFAAALAPLVLVFIFAASYYRRSAIEIKRHESVLRSTVFAKFSEAVYGTATIRAYGLQNHFSEVIRGTIDDMDGAYFLTFANQRWLSIRLDAIGNMMIFIIGMLVVTSRFNVNPSIGGVVLSYILGIVGMFQFAVRQLAEVENNMNSTERIHHYGTGLEEEAPLHIESAAVRPTWPERGEIVFDEVQMRYRQGLPLVLKGLTMHVAPGERIGIVGRTGAGKSSILATLFRIIELSSGSITIDGVDIARIGLHDLRSRMAIIPQDPTLFKGTVRSNLDPFNEHTDLEMWSALRQAGLADEEGAEANQRGSSNRVGLESVVQEEGLNFSLGQRQLMALARALVRGSRIIICDEATSSVDFATDLKIQRTMMEGFRGKTLLCIAHRLRTIIGYDRICVMDQGRIAELGPPLEVFDANGIFRGMCNRGGVRREDIVQAGLSSST